MNKYRIIGTVRGVGGFVLPIDQITQADKESEALDPIIEQIKREYGTLAPLEFALTIQDANYI